MPFAVLLLTAYWYSYVRLCVTLHWCIFFQNFIDVTLPFTFYLEAVANSLVYDPWKYFGKLNYTSIVIQVLVLSNNSNKQHIFFIGSITKNSWFCPTFQEWQIDVSYMGFHIFSQSLCYPKILFFVIPL